MFCSKCGKELPEEAICCAYCGSKIKEEGIVRDIPNEEVIKHMESDKKDKVNVAWAILSFIIPIVGLVIFLVKREDEPRTAKASGICALVSVGIGVVFTILYMVFAIVLVNNVFDTVGDITTSEYTIEYDEDYSDYEDIYNELLEEMY